MRPTARVYQFQPADIKRVCTTLSCTRAQLARTLGVSRACVSRWEKSLRAPQGGDAARLRAMVGERAGPAVDVLDLRTKLAMTQRVFGAQFGVSRQQVQKWESGTAVPHRNHLDKLVTLAATATAHTPPVTPADLLTVSGAATFAHMPFEDFPDLPAKIALHFKDQAADLPLGIPRPPREELLDGRVHGSNGGFFVFESAEHRHDLFDGSPGRSRALRAILAGFGAFS